MVTSSIMARTNKDLMAASVECGVGLWQNIWVNPSVPGNRSLWFIWIAVERLGLRTRRPTRLHFDV